MIDRRAFVIGLGLTPLAAQATTTGQFEIALSEAEWRARLSPARYAVLRDHATERPYTNDLMGEASPLLREARAGTYICAGCDLPLYRSETKYDSRTGWPSFWAAIDGAVGTQDDYTYLFIRRTEVHCRRCGGHQGHIFDDGPQPTGKRHCINGLAMHFVPD